MYRHLQRTLKCWMRLTKPRLSEFKSLEDLEVDLKNREIRDIERFNQKKLLRNRSYTTERMLSEMLSVSSKVSRQIVNQKIKFSAISPNSLKHYTLERPLDSSKINYPLLFEEIQPNVRDLEQTSMHFSYHRHVPVINNYNITSKSALLFNLPSEVTEKEIAQEIGIETIKSVKIEYCVLGLPAYAVVNFLTQETVNNLFINGKTEFEIGGRLCLLKTKFDLQSLSLSNRRLVIQNLDEDEDDLIFELSQYGRISHFDFPTFVTRNCSVDEVKKKYAKSRKLVKIITHKKNGQITSEFYPSLEESLEMEYPESPVTDHGIDNSINEKIQRLKEQYKHRMRFASEAHVYEGKENEVCLQNMGYCIVTYSCPEEAQNCYFNRRFQNKIQLFNSSINEEFQFDRKYRQTLLRIIDHDQRQGQVDRVLSQQKTPFEESIDAQKRAMSLYDRLVFLETRKKILEQKVVTEDTEEEFEVVMSYLAFRSREIKRTIAKKTGARSFDEMAEEELFGRVLSKKQGQELGKLQVQSLPELSEKDKNLQNMEVMEYLNSRNVQAKFREYAKRKRRANQKQSEERQRLYIDEEAEGEADAEVEETQEEQYSGKQGFSTIKNRKVAFRKRNSVEEVDYILRYCEFVRDVINEYLGVFPEAQLQQTQSSNTGELPEQSFLNPSRLTFSDGRPFLTEDDLGKALECMRDLKTAQQAYEDYFKENELIKTKNISLNRFKNLTRRDFAESIQQYHDKGVVQEVYEVSEEEDIEAKVRYLNGMVASFGEEFQAQKNEDGSQVIVKLVKPESIYPLDKIALFQKKQQQAVEKGQIELTPEKIKLFSKYKRQVLETGEFPEEVRSVFGIPSDKSVEDMFEELFTETGIRKKGKLDHSIDIETLLNIENYTAEQLGRDVGMQQQMEKQRQQKAESKASHYAKDPSNIEVRDRQGFFKVSKFRQI